MPDVDAIIDNEQHYRAAAYGLLAATLRAAPDQALLEHLSQLSPDGEDESDDLSEAMAELADAAGKFDLQDLETEYNALFIGIGKGEVVPYGSWYLTGFLMEQPLSDLRDDLQALGFERDDKTHEPEDHVAAIFEVFFCYDYRCFWPGAAVAFLRQTHATVVGKVFCRSGESPIRRFL